MIIHQLSFPHIFLTLMQGTLPFDWILMPYARMLPSPEGHPTFLSRTNSHVGGHLAQILLIDEKEEYVRTHEHVHLLTSGLTF